MDPLPRGDAYVVFRRSGYSPKYSLLYLVKQYHNRWHCSTCLQGRVGRLGTMSFCDLSIWFNPPLEWEIFSHIDNFCPIGFHNNKKALKFKGKN